MREITNMSSSELSGKMRMAAVFGIRPVLVVLALVISVAVGATAQVRPAQPSQPATTVSAPPLQPDESENEDEEARRPRAIDPATVLRTARRILVRSNTVFVKDSEVEDSLRKRKEFAAWGMIITRNELDADLIIEIERKSLTRRFTFTVLDPRTMAVLTSGKTRSVLFGKKIPNKIAEKFTNRVKVVRPYPAT